MKGLVKTEMRSLELFRELAIAKKRPPAPIRSRSRATPTMPRCSNLTFPSSCSTRVSRQAELALLSTVAYWEG